MSDVEEDYDIDNYSEEYIDDNQNTIIQSNKFTPEYEILKRDQFEKKREEQIQEFMTFSSLNHDEAELVLINFEWNYDKLQATWYENVELNKIKAGIEESPESKKKLKTNKNLSTCLICEDDLPKGKGISLKCKHIFCQNCFSEYLKNKLDDPLTIISSPCPLKGCNLITTGSIFKKCLSKNDYKKYFKFILNNFTESNSDIKWCPNQNCGNCIRLPGHGMKEIKCTCGSVFCFKCLRETHRPCDCEMIEKWEKKNSSDSENCKWISLNTKQCPRCRKYIEKNQGCNHMTCRKEAGGCGYEFCWICLGDWKKHGNSYYNCKFTKEEVKSINYSETKYYLEKYIYHFEQYMNHHKAQKYAVELREKIKEYKNIFFVDYGMEYMELEFLDKSVDTIIDCRRMLKNTYVFGHYLKEDKQKIKLFEFNLNLLDNHTDRLHELMEQKEIPDLLETKEFECFQNKFNKIRTNALNLIGSIGNYKENLLDEIENQLIKFIDYKIFK